MRMWVTYFAAFSLGLATAFLFSQSQVALMVMTAASSYLVNLGACLAVLMLLFTFPAAIASLGRDKSGRKIFPVLLLWAVATALALSFLGLGLFLAFPSSFPVTSTSSSAPVTLQMSVDRALSSSIASMTFLNPLWTAGTSVGFLLPMLLLLAALGLALTPRSDIIRPAYTVMNSFSEVMHRLGRVYAMLSFTLVYFSSSALFLGLWQEESAFSHPFFFVLLTGGVLVIILAVLPLLYVLFTGFRGNPYKVLCRVMPALVLSFLTASRNAALPLELSLSRGSLGIQKKAGASAIPFLSVAGRGGSAFVSVMATLSIYLSIAETLPSKHTLVLLALVSAAASFLASSASGAEPALITVLALNLAGVELYGAENSLIALLPLLAGAGLMIDSLIALLGTSVAASRLGAVYELSYKDIL